MKKNVLTLVVIAAISISALAALIGFSLFSSEPETAVLVPATEQKVERDIAEHSAIMPVGSISPEINPVAIEPEPSVSGNKPNAFSRPTETPVLKKYAPSALALEENAFESILRSELVAAIKDKPQKLGGCVIRLKQIPGLSRVFCAVRPQTVRLS